MKKLFLILSLLLLVSMPLLVKAADLPIVQCGNADQAPCTFADFFTMAVRIFKFLVIYIAFPLTGLLLVIGGILLLVSAGNPGLAGTAKNMLKGSIIALAIILFSYLIIDAVFHAVGLGSSWSNF